MEGNVCKFILAEEGSSLQLHRFVYEQDPEVLSRGIPSGTHYMLFLAVAGEGVLALGEQRYPLQVGGLYVVFPGEDIRLLEGGGATFCYLTFGGARVPALFWRFGICPECRFFSEHRSLIPFWKESLATAGEGNLDLIGESVLLYTLSRFCRAENAGDRVVRELIRYMGEHLSDPRLTLSRAAERCGYHPKYLSHRFKQCTGVGFQRYLRDLRIRNAIFLFDHGLDSVKNVSLLCGFEDALYFSRVFKECVGRSPRDYLRQKELDKNKGGGRE